MRISELKGDNFFKFGKVISGITFEYIRAVLIVSENFGVDREDALDFSNNLIGKVIDEYDLGRFLEQN